MSYLTSPANSHNLALIGRCAYLQLILARTDDCRLVAFNPGSVASNPGSIEIIVAINPGLFRSCLHV